jgi:hypothetical protein
VPKLEQTLAETADVLISNKCRWTMVLVKGFKIGCDIIGRYPGKSSIVSS